MCRHNASKIAELPQGFLKQGRQVQVGVVSFRSFFFTFTFTFTLLIRKGGNHRADITIARIYYRLFFFFFFCIHVIDL